MERSGQGQIARPYEDMTGYTHITNDLCVSRDALVLDGVSVQDDGNNAVCVLHEGRNAAAPVILAINSLGGQGGWRHFPRGVELDSGLFVDLDAHVTSVTVFWRPRTEREA